MRTPPSPGTYIAYSLAVAKATIQNLPPGVDYRRRFPEVFAIAGINKIVGLVSDPKTGDIILVGKHAIGRAPLTLDDFVVALRARFIHREWPAVSIDPPASQNRREQIVRFEGGIENTQFGADLINADYQLKLIGMGHLPTGDKAVRSYWGNLRTTPAAKLPRGSTRFWFFPVLSNVTLRQGVIAISDLSVQVLTEQLGAEKSKPTSESSSRLRDPAADKFAEEVNRAFPRMAMEYQSFSRVWGLSEIVALATAIEEIHDQSTFNFWIRSYSVRRVPTTSRIPRYRRQEISENRRQGLSGGVKLAALAIRLRSGDVSALRESVLLTKPHATALRWKFIVSDWVIPTTDDSSHPEVVRSLFREGLFQMETGQFRMAEKIFSHIANIRPDSFPASWNAGFAAVSAGRLDVAAKHFDRAIALDPKNASAYLGRGVVYQKLGDFGLAIQNYTIALNLSDSYSTAYLNRGIAIKTLNGDAKAALEDIERAIALDPDNGEAYFRRGTILYELGHNRKALDSLTKAVERDTQRAAWFVQRSNVLAKIWLHERALKDLDMAIALDPTFLPAYLNRGVVNSVLGNPQLAIGDYTRALELEPSSAKAYFGRGTARASKKDLNGAWRDLSKAIKIDPKYAKALNHRGYVGWALGNELQACKDLKAACNLGECEILHDTREELGCN
jgi:tetratricopeptide (TPR) repeat protein